MKPGTYVGPREQDGVAKESRGRVWSIGGALVAAAVIYGLGSVLVIARPVPPRLAWGLLAGAAGLVVMACLVGAAGPVSAWVKPVAAGWRRKAHTPDEWAESWEDLVGRPVR
ncbi:MAG: hypothetical protein HY680_10045 [Chloroflexi bacterium]|nr:hypothetical protein [Chloroflexota bacterium]